MESPLLSTARSIVDNPKHSVGYIYSKSKK